MEQEGARRRTGLQLRHQGNHGTKDQPKRLKDTYDALATPATGAWIARGALVRKEFRTGEPQWVDKPPEAVRLELKKDPADKQAPEIKLRIKAFSRPAGAAVPGQVARRPNPDRSVREPQFARRTATPVGECRRGIVPDNPSMGMQIPSVHDAGMAPPGKHAASAFAYAFPVETSRDMHGQLKNVMAEKVIDKISRFAPNFRDIQIRHITFAPYHMQTMFAAPSGDFCHGLLHPDLMGPNRPGPKGFLDMPIPTGGLYLGGAGCHGGPGITFIPGYNAAYAALDDLAVSRETSRTR